MKYCKFCGNQIESEAVFCVKCGRQLEELKVASPPPQNVGTPEGYCNKWISLCLWLLLGTIGGHKFYERKPGVGAIYIGAVVFGYIIAGVSGATGSIGGVVFSLLIFISLGIALLVDLISILSKPTYYPAEGVRHSNPVNTSSQSANSNFVTMIKVNGSNDFIESAGYKLENRQLYIKFASGNVTLYDNVPEHVYKGLINTLSPKNYYNENINGIYNSVIV